MLRWVCVALLLSASWSAAADADPGYVADIERARLQRMQQLLGEEGWLTVVGLHFLEVGGNTVGTLPENNIVLTTGPERLGTVVLEATGKVTLTLNPAVDDVQVNGVQVLSTVLREEGVRPPTRVTFGSASFHVIERNGKKALRVKDREAGRRRNFAGIDYFPIDPSWRIEADWVMFDRPKEVMIRNSLGQEMPAMMLGKAVFEKEGHTVELMPLVEGGDQPMMFVIADATSGRETYAAARFVYAEPPRGGKVLLDFNLAINPPCAFTPYATCPLPPSENRMPIAVRAGEKDYRGTHE